MRSLPLHHFSPTRKDAAEPLLSRSALPLPSHRREILRSSMALGSLWRHWDTLLERSGVRTPFLRADWLEIWSAIFADTHEPWVGTAWLEDGTLAAAVPFAISPGMEGPRRHLRHLTFLGGMSEVVSEGQDLLALPGMEPVLDCLLEEVLTAVSGEWDVAHFPFLDMQSPYLPLLLAALQRVGAEPELVNQQSSPSITLDAPDWEACLRESSSRFRRKLRKRRMSAEAKHEVRFRTIESSAEAAAAMEQLLDLHGERWKPHESLFLQPRTRRFHSELVRRWSPLQRVWLHVLEFNGRPAAMDYLFADHGRAWDYQGGWKAELADYSPAYLLRVEGIQRAISVGLREYDLLPGCAYKTHWTKSGRQVADIEAIHPASLKAQTFFFMRSLKRELVRHLPQNHTPPA